METDEQGGHHRGGRLGLAEDGAGAFGHEPCLTVVEQLNLALQLFQLRQHPVWDFGFYIMMLLLAFSPFYGISDSG